MDLLETKFPYIFFDLSKGEYLYRSQFKGANIERALECDELSEAKRRAQALEVSLNRPDRTWLEKLRIEIS